MKKFEESDLRYLIFKKKYLNHAIIFYDVPGEIIYENRKRIQIYKLPRHNKINYLKYKLKSGKISEERYLKELIKCQNQTKN